MIKNTICFSILFSAAVLSFACMVNRSAVSDSAGNSQNNTANISNPSSPKVENKTQNSRSENIGKNDASANDKKNPTENKTENKIENRCGWYENPTPGNHWLTDKDGEWLIGTQGGFQADGDYPPEFPDDQWVKTNVSYGYGCACLRVLTDKKEMKILKVVSATAKPLSACRNDKALKEPAE